MLLPRSPYRLGRDENDIQQIPWLGNLDHRVLRTTISALSILTTKATFTNGFHHPLRLLMLHLLATLFWEIMLWLSSNKIERTFDAKDYTLYELARRANLSSRTGLKLCFRFGCGIGALICEYVAICRFRSLPALSMLFLPDWGQLVYLVRHRDITVSRKILACLGCAVGLVMILGFETQLSEVGVKSASTGLFLGLAAQLLRQEPSSMDNTRCTSLFLPVGPVRDKAILLPLAIFVTAVGIYKREYWIYTPPLSKVSLAVLAINVLAAVLAFQYSGSHFRRSEPVATFHGVEEDLDDDEVEPMLETLALYTVIALGSFLISPSDPASIVSIEQYVGFLVVLIALFWIGRQCRPAAVDDTYYTPIGASLHSNTEHRLPGFETLDLNQRHRGIKWSNLLQATFIGFCILLSASLISLPNTSTQPSPHRLPRDDQPATSPNETRSLDFVVSRFDEPADQIARQINSLHELQSLHSLSTRLIVYTTGTDNIQTLHHDLRTHLHPNIALYIHARDNVGREAAAYLTHILSYYSDLTSHTLFLQAAMHTPLLASSRLENYFVPQTGFLSLSDTYCGSNTCDPHPWDHSAWSEDPLILAPIFSLANVSERCVDYTYTYRGQFLVSAQRIQTQSRKLFEHLLYNLIDQNASTHTENYANMPWLRNHGDSLNRPRFGYTMEMIWGVVFGCEGKMVQCPSLMSGALGERLGLGRRGGVGDCQCLD